MNSTTCGQLEATFAETYGVNYAVSTCSGTTAYLTGLRALKLPPQSEIVLPVYGWPQLVAGAQVLGHPVRLVDTDESGRMVPEAVERVLTPSTGAVVVCHLFGNPVDVPSIVRCTRKLNIPVIEDCSQALFAYHSGRRVGTWGDVGFASLGAGKILSADEGGLLWTNEPSIYRQALVCSQHPDRIIHGAQECILNSLSLRMHPAGARRALADIVHVQQRIRRVSRAHELFWAILRNRSDRLRRPEVDPQAVAMWQHCPVIAPDEDTAHAIDELTWDKRPAFLLSDDAVFAGARRFDAQVRYIQSGRQWEDVRREDLEQLADALVTACGQ